MTEKFELKNSYGEKLAGVIHPVRDKPPHAAAAAPIAGRISNGVNWPTHREGEMMAIVCHGFTRHKDKNWITAGCARIAAEVGIPAARFDFSGNGESEGEFAKASYIKEAKDLRSVIDVFESRGYKRFLLVGHSMGSAVCMLEASEDHIVLFSRNSDSVVTNAKDPVGVGFFHVQLYRIGVAVLDRIAEEIVEGLA